MPAPMTSNEDTRVSLILRLPTASDAEAWREFIDIYEPIIYRFARRRGLQDADAKELIQNVLVAVARSVQGWRPDPARGPFRAWLFRIARNQLINMAAKVGPDRASGRTEELAALYEQIGAPEGSSQIELEYRREVFRAAAAQVRDACQSRTWQAFWDTAVGNQPIEQVAKSLDMTVGAVYIARSRVLYRLKELIQTWERHDAL